MNTLPENVYSLIDNPPTKDQANEDGKVLYYSPGFGWYQGYWANCHLSGTTHWTFCPDTPPGQADLNAFVVSRFEHWLSTFPTEFDASAKTLILLGWKGAAKTLAKLID